MLSPPQAWFTDLRGGEHLLDAAALDTKQARYTCPLLRCCAPAHTRLPQVIHVRDCTDAVFTLPAAVTVAKLFIERCTRCSFALHGRLITGHVELWGSADVALALHAPLPTLQADLCTAVALRYAARGHLGAVVHAGVRGLSLTCETDDAAGAPALERELAPPPREGEAAPPDDAQFITRWCAALCHFLPILRFCADC